MAQSQAAVQQQSTLAGQVFGLLGFSFVFTAAGAALAPRLGSSATAWSGIGALVVLLVINFVRGLSPTVRLGLFYLYSVLAGIGLGSALRGFSTGGDANLVALAAGTTAITLGALAVYGWTTKRELAGWGGYLFIGLIGILIAGIVGLFVQAEPFHVVLAGVTAIVFGGYTAVHFQQLSRNQGEPIGLALAIYLDIFNFFWAILRLFQAADNRR